MDIKTILSCRIGIAALLLCGAVALQAKSVKGADSHTTDMLQVFPFENNKRIYDFYVAVSYYLDHPNGDPHSQKPRFVKEKAKFQKMTFPNHRIWYHWGFNRTDIDKLRTFKPLRENIQRNIEKGRLAKKNEEAFWNELQKDVSRRNRELMNKAAKLFGYGKIGSISSQQRSQLNGFVSMLYDIHILGDYTTTEKSLLLPVGDLYSDIEQAIRNIAGTSYPDNKAEGEKLIRLLRRHQGSTDDYLDTLKHSFSDFMLKLRGGLYNYKSKFERQGFQMKK
ncbi:MAG: hypothetical protein Q4E55_02950 [Bacteroidales bacterium]|nr:hypothetical protein [Bacteroidales bacterium]